MKSDTQLIHEFQAAVYKVCTAALGDNLQKANQQLPKAYQALLDRFTELRKKPE